MTVMTHNIQKIKKRKPLNEIASGVVPLVELDYFALLALAVRDCFATLAMTLFVPAASARRGFTMIEMMTVMAIISVVSSIVLPGVNNFYSGERVKAVAEILVQNVRFAKFKAMQEQALHRMIFSATGDTYKIQMHSGYLEGNTPPDLTSVTADASYDSVNWESILESDEIEIDPGVTVTREGYLQPRIVYFWPDGYLVTHNSTGISETNKIRLGECHILFEYGSSRIRVYLNALGVLSSESYSVDEDGDSDTDVIW